MPFRQGAFANRLGDSTRRGGKAKETTVWRGYGLRDGSGREVVLTRRERRGEGEACEEAL